MLETIFARKAEFEIVAMELDDCHDVSELHGQRFSQPWNDGAFESLLLQPNVFGFVVRQTNTLMFKPQLSGFVLAREAAGEAEILTIAVHEKGARNGLGWRLMQGAMRESRVRGGEIMFLEVDDGNHPAINLYRKLGFEKAGERPAYYADANGRRSAALVMRRDLR
ncbi:MULTISPECIES: GNAT family N-acetyltransferase [Rhizobium/Agrobacterium group]|uniref:GNAT family N-acetyltransferase n=1 Tax=Rhizobium/Agrobacterium group TaxID=227290 RepID=UPI0012E8B27C|nr:MULTISPECIES: N-acetyltransferase [Rhizobium/Agrobacterium group]MCF1474358.1 GNAT family N-acetyltransferase [Allorhizobium ampelinum]MVA51654.1 GNAT family N-acetyltransferase [Agrobacterium vitis]NSZ51617.1 GNAT family N-acetyltransferase [Agrobacterium vitis]NTA30376.1 GNAT family N-acetyltransferase [Agrobacterium vitis]